MDNPKNEPLTLDVATPFIETYSNIQDIFDGKSELDTKWKDIATLVDDKSDVFQTLFRSLKKDPNKSSIKLDYTIKYSALKKQINAESNLLVKICWIILALHHMVYTLISHKNNHTISLDGSREIDVLTKPVTYFACISAKNEQNIFFHTFILVFSLESIFNKHFYVGFDFEFSRKEIRLMQMNYEHNEENRNIMMVVHPEELTETMMENFIYCIMCNKYIRKIVHGSDALDMPYVYDKMLKGEPRQVMRFTRTLIDTRFLCEYYKLNRKEVQDDKCRVYDEEAKNSAIYYFHVISTEQQNNLQNIIQSLPPVHDIVWNIHKLNEPQTMYALYDVLFLKFFYKQIIQKAINDEKTESDKKNVETVYRHILYEMTQFAYLDKRSFVTVSAKCKEEVNPIGNYMVGRGADVLKFVDVYNRVSPNIVIDAPKVNLDSIINVNYYKSIVNIIVKKMIYTILSNNYIVRKTKTEEWREKLSNTYIFDFFEEMQYTYLGKMFKAIERILNERIKKLIPVQNSPPRLRHHHGHSTIASARTTNREKRKRSNK